MMKRNPQLNVFSGPTALRDFLNPDEHPMLPLVEIPECLNPYATDGVRIYAKLMNFLPLANIKSLPALSMLTKKEAAGDLKQVSTLIENSSGNTVFSLGILARLFGINATKAIVSHEVSYGKLQLLRFFGIDITVNEEPICPDPSDKESGIYKAKHWGLQNGWWNPGQYENEANPEAHRHWTGPQILEQTAGNLTVFCAGLGTTGTMVGAGGYLKQRAPRVTNIGVVRKANNPVPGVRTNNLLQEIAFHWHDAVDETVEIGTKASFEQSLLLCRHGILVGPSAGFSLAGLFEFLKQKKDTNDLDRLRNSDGEIVAVFICPDSPFPYIDEYFEYLDEGWFSKMENEHLLRNNPEKRSANDPSIFLSGNVDVQPEEAFNAIYSVSTTQAWKLTDGNESLPIRPNVRVIDIRDRLSFDHAHVPGSIQLEYQDLLNAIEEHGVTWKQDSIFLMCGYGNRSRVIASLLRRNGVTAYSVEGGMLEWSRINLPRWRPEVCKT